MVLVCLGDRNFSKGERDRLELLGDWKLMERVLGVGGEDVEGAKVFFYRVFVAHGEDPACFLDRAVEKNALYAHAQWDRM